MKPAALLLSRPVISEKAFALSDSGRYVFRVPTSATKIEVRQAVEREFGVKVVSINSMITKGRSRRYGRITGRTKDYKKVVVQLAEGQKIAMFEEEPVEQKEEKK